MSDNLTRAERDLPKLRQYVDQLMLLVNNMLQQPISYSEKDHLAFMSLCFLSKQVEYLKSICILIDADQCKDAVFIVRNMIEGMSLLIWAAQDASTRSLLWRSFALVEDFRLMKNKEWMGEKIDSNEKSALLERLRVYGPKFYSEKARKAIQKKLPLPEDPYRKNWTGKKVWEICEEINGQLLYRQIYQDVSSWMHWSPSSVGTYIFRQNNHVVYVNIATDKAAMALSSGFHSLLETAAVADSHLSLGFADRLATLRETYIKGLMPTLQSLKT